MAVRLHAPGLAHAQAYIEAGNVFLDGPGAWDEHRPTEADEIRYVARHGLGNFGKWHLGVDDEADPHSRSRYRFPYGDFSAVHRCGVLAAEVSAARERYRDIQEAAAHLHALLDLLRSDLELGSTARSRDGEATRQ
jgi:hypothetical protein